MLFNAKNPHGGDLYSQPVELDFSANVNPYGTPEGVRQAVRDCADSLSHYPDPQCRELVAAIASFEEVSASAVLCGNGAADLIYAFCAACKPRKGLLLAPSFCEYEKALAVQNCEIEYYFMSEAQGFRLTEDFLSTLRGFSGDALLLCTPNNPTGQVVEPALLKEILYICREKGIRVLLDECFLDLTSDNEGLSMKPFLSEFPGLVILKAFTKSYGMAALRLGYCLCGNPDLLTAMARQTQLWNVSIPAQHAGVAALKETVFLEKARETIFSQREMLISTLSGLGLRVIPGRANYLLFYSQRELKAPLLSRGILIRSCDNYPGLTPGWYRIAVKLPEENRRLIQTLEEILHG